MAFTSRQQVLLIFIGLTFQGPVFSLSPLVYDETKSVTLPDYTECGGILPVTGHSTTKVNYKSAGNTNNNEFCVWTFVWSSRLTSVTFRIGQSITDDQDGLVAYTWNGTDLVSQKIPHNITSLTFRVSPLILAFSTNDFTPSKGITITARGPCCRYSGPVTTYPYHFFDEEGMFKFPQANNPNDILDMTEIVTVVVQGQKAASTAFKKMTLRDLTAGTTAAVYTLLPYHPLHDPYYAEIGKFKGGEERRVVGATTFDVFPNVYIFSVKQNKCKIGFTIQWSKPSNSQYR